MSSNAIQRMFDSLAPKYDLFNFLASFSLDRYWRMRAIQRVHSSLEWDFHLAPARARILDVCTGTGKLAVAVKREIESSVVGIDFSRKMLMIAKHGTPTGVEFLLAKAEEIPFRDNTFDYVTNSFAMRNVIRNITTVLNEMYRVMKFRGRIIILEIGNPELVFLKRVYHFYLKKVLPLIGMSLYGRKAPFYYLADSVINFGEPQEFREKIRGAGFRRVQYFSLTGGIAIVYTGVK